jgi:HD-GYP domain-containing protein (c-di-GMP phosphodiesterase class II)
MTSRYLTLRRRLATGFLLGALVPLVVFSLLIYMKTSSGLHRIEKAQLAESTTAIENTMAQEQQAGLNAAVASGSFTNRLKQRAHSELTRDLWTMVQTLNLVQAEVLDARGHLLARASIIPSPRPLGHGNSSFSFQTYLGKLWLVSNVPIRTKGSEGAPLGTLVAAGQINDGSVGAAAERSGYPVSMYVGRELVASSSEGAERTLSPLAEAGENYVAGDRTISYTGLGDALGRPVALIAVNVPNGAYASMWSSTKATLQLALVLALVAAAIAALVISRMVTGPLQTLTSAARAITRGDWRQHLEVRGNDEVAVVTEAFNEMSDRITQTVEDLSQQLQSLSSELADISVVGETLSQTSDIQTDLLQVAGLVREATGSDFCAFHLLEGKLMQPAVHAGDINGATRALRELALLVTSARQAISTTELANDERLSRPARRAASEISSVTAVPLIHQGRALGVVAVGSRDVRPYSPRTAAILSTVANQVAVALSHASTYRELEQSYLQTVMALAAALEAKDEYTADHAESLADLACATGRVLGLTKQQLRQLEFAAVLHDVGKIGVPAHILNKPDTLSESERAMITQHTVIGERIVSRIDYLRPLAPIIRAAHERWDGLGYPDGLLGEAIPLEARIVFVCDAFHAMISDRPYRAKMNEAQALYELRAYAGTQFDPAVVMAFAETRPVAGTMTARQTVRVFAAR